VCELNPPPVGIGEGQDAHDAEVRDRAIGVAPGESPRPRWNIGVAGGGGIRANSNACNGAPASLVISA